MTDEEFNQFLKENEQKLKENIFSDLEPYNIEQEANLSTSLGGSSNEEDSNSNKISFIHKRKRSIDFITNDLDNIFQKEQADPFINNENAFESFGGKEKEVNIELDEDKSDNLFKNIMSNNNGILNNNNMPLNIFKNDMNELSIDSIESDINNSFTNSFKEKELIFGFDNCVINYEKFLVKNNLEHAFNINN